MSLISDITDGIKVARERNKAQKMANEATKIIERTDSIVQQRMKEIEDMEKASSGVANVTPMVDALTFSKAVEPKYIGNNKRVIVFNGIYMNSWNLLDMYHGYTAESYMKFAVDSYVESCIRSGYYVKSKNPTVVQYINKRMKEFELISGIGEEELMRSVFFSTVLFGNAFLAKYRNEDKSSGKMYKRFDGKDMVPIATLYLEDARRILINKEDNSARFTYYRTPFFNMGQRRVNAMPFYMGQRALNVANPSNVAYEGSVPRGIFAFMQRMGKAFSSFIDQNNADIPIRDEDMVHIRFHATPGEKWAMPPFFPALADVDTLRMIEENMELLIFQYGHPFFHVKIGDEKRYGTQEEMDDVAAKITAMESNGFLVTNQRVDVAMPQVTAGALKLDSYIDYFKKRMFTGLWLSPVSTGEGGTVNRATADMLDRVKQDKTIELQSIVSDAFENLLIELLQEGGAPLDWIMKPENRPQLYFNEVDMAKKISLETHVLAQYNASMISRTEARHALGLDPLADKEDDDTFAMIQARAKAVYAVPTGGPGGGGKSAAGKPSGAPRQMAAPTNQHGTKTAPKATQNT